MKLNHGLKESKMDKTRLFKLFKEPSTYAGLGLIVAAMLGFPVGSGEQIASLLAGVVSIFLPEGAKEK